MQRRPPQRCLRPGAVLLSALHLPLAACNLSQSPSHSLQQGNAEVEVPAASPPAPSSTAPELGEAKEKPLPTLEEPDPKEEAERARYPSGAGKWTPRSVPADEPRIYAKTRNVWIRGRPDSGTQWVGFLWFGMSVKLKSETPVAGPGCRNWYAIEPRGYVCGDGKRATIDPDDPVVQTIFPYGANVEAANTHPFYGEAVDAQRYITLPTENTQARREWDYRKRMQRIVEARAGEERVDSLIGVDLTPVTQKPPIFSELPTTLQMPHRRLKPRSTVAWMRQAHHGGRDWLLSDDLTWVPKDRVKPYPEVTFKGLHLNEKVSLPLAFFRGEDRPKLVRDGDDFRETGEDYPRLGWVSLTGESLVTQESTYHATRDGHWIDAAGAVIPELREKTPWGAAVEAWAEAPGAAREAAEPSSGEDVKEPRGRGTWIDVSVLGGWLVAYEGTKPIFVTMMSPGRGGVPQRGVPAIETAATPTGRFKITGKFVTSTMISPTEMVHSAVPWAQNFSGPHALHGAYWHDQWGEGKSGGCINVSPQDGRFLFDWTEPKIPQDWHGVRWLPKKEAATTLLVRR